MKLIEHLKLNNPACVAEATPARRRPAFSVLGGYGEARPAFAKSDQVRLGQTWLRRGKGEKDEKE